MHRRITSLIAMVFVTVLPEAARAQDSAESRLRLELADAIVALQRAERAAIETVGDGSLERLNDAAGVMAEHAAVLAHVRTVLDTVVFSTAWGPAELMRLRARHPGSSLFELYAARWFLQTGRADSAFALLEAIAHRIPASVEVHLALADAHVSVPDTAQAIRALTRALEIAPDDEAIFGRLLALRRAEGSLERLLAQIRRLQLRLPESQRMIEREVELLHRLGRLDEARTAAARLREEGDA